MSMINDRRAALLRVQQADFALTEANLYLDTHPRCMNGLAYFRRMRAERNRAVQDYEARFGPLTADAAKAEGAWDWTEKPWPWETEA